MIGVFDSGVGGLCALRRAQQVMPRADFVYFGDTRNLPYGERSACEILTLARRALALLEAEGAEAVLAACGTVSSVALPLLRDMTKLPVFGVIEPTARAAARAARKNGGEVALLSTAATARAGVLAHEITRFAPHARVRPLACPLFVHLAEGGCTARCDPLARMSASRILAPLHTCEIRTVVLGCTHFSCLTDLLTEFFPRATMIDAAAEGALAMNDALPVSKKAGRGECRLLTSGDASAFSHAATAILGHEVTARHIS